MHALAHLGPTVPNLDDVVLAKAHHRPSDLLEAVAKTRVLQPDTKADRSTGGYRLLIGRSNSLEAGPRSEAAIVHHLAGAPDHTRGHQIARAHLPTRDTDQLRETIDHPFHGELRLIGAEPAERSAHRVVRAHRDGLHIDGRHHIRTRRMTGGPLEHLHADRGVRPRVTDHPHPERGQVARFVAARRVLHADRVPLGVHEERLLTTEGRAHRTVEQPGGERRLPLIRHVLLAAERAAVAHQFGHHARPVDIEDPRDVIAVIPDALTTREHHEPTEVDRVTTGAATGQRQRFAGRHRNRERRLRLKERVVDALSLERLRHHVSRRRERLVNIPA